MRVPVVVAALLAVSALPAGAARTAETRPVERPAPPASAQWRVEDGAARRVPPALAELGRAPGPATYRAALLDGLERAGFTGRFRAAAEGDAVTVYADPVGDLDGDRLRDVAEVVENMSDGSTTLRARRGVDGRVLWTKSLPDAAFLAPAKVGASGAPGLVVVTDAYEATADTGVETLSVFALDGRGTELWRQTFRGVLSSSPASFAGASLPYVGYPFDGVAGPADDFVVGLYEIVETPAFSSAALSPLVIDGATGRMTPLEQMESTLDYFPFAAGVGDLSGDKLDDVLVVGPGPVENAGRIAAYQANGTPIWVAHGLDAFVVADLRDVNGDGRDDVGVTALTSTALEVSVLSGANGTVLARLDGEFAFPLGDADRDGRADVGTADFGFTGSFLAFRGYRGDGRRLYERRIAVAGPSGGGMMVVTAGNAGDVQGDGVTDAFYSVATASLSGKTSSTSGVLDGRNGAPVHSRKPTWPAYAAVDARGDDFAEAGLTKAGVLTVSAQQGSTGLPLWESSIRHRDVGSEDGLAAAPLDADRCADVLVSTTIGDRAILVAIRGRDGKLLWGREITSGGERVFTGLHAGPDRNKGC